MNDASPTLLHAAEQIQADIRPDTEVLEALLPEGVAFDDNVWDVGVWVSATRPPTVTLPFDRIGNSQLNDATKIIVLQMRMNGSGPNSVRNLITAAAALGKVLGARRIATLRTADAHKAAQFLLPKSATYLKYLSTLLKHLRRLYGVTVHFKAPKTAESRHGTKGTDKGRQKKRVSDAVLKLVLQILHHDDLPADDRLFVSALAFNLGCGWRIGELLTLPKDCLFWDEGSLRARGHPLKNGKTAPKMVPHALAPMVEKAYHTIVQITDPARQIVKDWMSKDDPDWRTVLKDEGAILYFAQKILHAWAMELDHLLINPDAAWSRDYGWIDVLGEIKKHKSERQAYLALGLNWNTFAKLKNEQLAAREGRLLSGKSNNAAWFRDKRVCDKYTLFQQMGLATGQAYHTPQIEALVEQALEYQKSGGAIPLPQYNAELERNHARHPPVILADKRGRPLIYADKALFVAPRFFIGRHAERTDDWQAITHHHFIQWLGGTSARSSVFERYEIMDPATGETAKFTSHQIRHWLETQLHKGGLTDSQIATLMNRIGTSGNSVYNQMSNAERRKAADEGIHAGTIGGVLVDAIAHADMTQEEAQDVLDARLRQINVMPHGLCLKNLATEPCPHHMSCFSTQDDKSRRSACSHLLVDTNDPEQVTAIRREHENATAMVEMFEDEPDLEDSPQVEHFRTIADTTHAFLKGEADT